MKRQIVGLAVILIGFNTQPALAMECTVAALTDQCKELSKNGSTQYISLGGDSSVRNPAYDESYWSWITTSNNPPAVIPPRRLKRVEELGRSVKASLIASIKQGRPDAALNSVEKSQIERLRTIKILVQDDASIREGLCGTARPNAHYNGRGHEITICAATMMLPESAIAFTLGHEIGHAIDPCTMQSPLMKLKDGSYNVEHLNGELSQLKPEGTIVGPASSGARFPQLKMATCLQNAGYGAGMTEAAILKFATEAAELQQGYVEGSPAAKKEIQRITAVLKKYPMCFGGERFGNSLNEAVGDTFGARALGDYLETHPASNPVSRLAMFSNFLRDVCGYNKDQDEDGIHLSSLARIEKIMLTNPKVQRSLGCTSKATPCDSYVIPPAAQPAPEPEDGRQ